MQATYLCMDDSCMVRMALLQLQLNDPEDQLNGGETIHVPVITMEKVVQAFKYPQNAHHSEQLTIQKLKLNA